MHQNNQYDFHVRFCSCCLTLAQRMSLVVAQELPTLPEHLSSPQIFSGFTLLNLQLIILVFYGSLFVLLAIVLSVLLPSDYPFGIFWPLYCLSCFRPITPLVSFGHCIVCSASVRLPLWYLLAIVLSVLLPSDYPFSIF